MAKTKKPQTASGDCYGILNPYGDMWTYRSFETEAEARAFIKNFWRDDPGDISRFKVVRARFRASYIADQ